MPAKKSAASATTKPAKRTSGRDTSPDALTAEELAALKETVQERKAAASGADGERALLDKIAEMPEPDRSMAQRIHELVRASAPTLVPRTWYGMPAYAMGGKVLCFFQPASKFKARYATLGFDDSANLDEGAMWPTSWALRDLTPDTEATIAALLKKAVS
jgi:uncharacterized protein YdhG (YjbR/CyaY superfamily)